MVIAEAGNLVLLKAVLVENGEHEQRGADRQHTRRQYVDGPKSLRVHTASRAMDGAMDDPDQPISAV